MSYTTTIEEIIENEGRFIYKNVGVSMMPLLRQNRDLIVIEKCDPDKLKPMDAVVFKRSNGDYVLHRIIYHRSDGTYWIVGDNCIYGEMVAPEQIIGKLCEIIRDGKTVDFDGALYKLYLQFWINPYKIRFKVISLMNLLRRAAGWLKLRILKSLTIR